MSANPRSPIVDRREFLQDCLTAAAAAGSMPGMAEGFQPPAKQTRKKWYQRSYRRHFFDMHVPDWNEDFWSKLNAREILENLQVENVTSVAFMFLSHTGLAHYPSKVGQVHKAFQNRDILRDLIDQCHRKGYDVVMYYCLLYTDWYWETHPEARCVDVNGNHLRPSGVGNRHAGQLCPNSREYRDFVVSQLTEICQGYEFEGAWPDMTWWPTVCYCKSCRSRYAAEIGGEIPRIVDWRDPVWVGFQRKRQAWLAEFAHLVTSTIRKLKPEVTVAHQSGQLARGYWLNGASAELAEAMDWLSADTYADRATQACINKLFYSLSNIKPFEHFNVWIYPNVREHVVARTEEDLRYRIFDAVINDGAMCFIDAFDPAGTLNRDNYVRAGTIFREVEKYEPYIGGTFRQDLAIYRSYDSSVPNRFVAQPVAQALRMQTDPAAQASDHTYAWTAMGRVLLDHHLPFGVIGRKNLGQLADYQIVLLPNVAMLSAEEVSAFRRFVEEGGSLYASKYTSLLSADGRQQENFQLSDMFGVTYLGETQEVVTYVDPKDKYRDLFLPFRTGYPCTLKDSQALVRVRGNAEVIATVTLPYTDPKGPKYASILSDPPGISTEFPSVVLNAYGKGKVMYSAGAMEIWDYSTQRAVLAKLLLLLASRPFCFEAEGPKPVEVTVFEQADRKRFILHFLNCQQDLPNIPVEGMSVKIWVGQKVPADLAVLPEGRKVDYVLREGRVEFAVPRIKTYLMLGLTYK